MRIRVSNRIADHKDDLPRLSLENEKHDHYVRVWYDGACFELAIDLNGRLTLREIEGRALIVKPIGSNTIEIKAEPWT